MVDAVIEAKSLGKYYRIYRGGIEKWMDLLLPGNHGINFWALRKLSFQVSAGETVGLVGLNGSGKSTIANELRKRGFAVYDCDREAKRIIAENTAVQQAIIELLGEEAFINGQYNTAYVARRVFDEPKLLAALNSIVHPAVRKDICQRNPDFVESAILVEAGLDDICDKVIARTIERDYEGQATPDNINKVRARIRAQKSPAAGVPQGKFYSVTNDGRLVLSRVVDLVCDIAAR